MSVAEVRGFLAGIVGFIIGLGYAVTCKYQRLRGPRYPAQFVEM